MTPLDPAEKIEFPEKIKKDVEEILKAPKNFHSRNAGRILPGQFYNHRSKTFLKNKRKGL